MGVELVGWIYPPRYVRQAFLRVGSLYIYILSPYVTRQKLREWGEETMNKVKKIPAELLGDIDMTQFSNVNFGAFIGAMQRNDAGAPRS